MTEATPSEHSDISAYAEAHPDSCQLLPSGRLRFTLTGMEFPPTASTKLLESYENGRALRRARVKEAMNALDLGEHARYIVDHRIRDPKFFYWCLLTKVTVPKIPHKIKEHVAGKKFQAAFKVAETKRLAQEAAQKERRERRDKLRVEKAKDAEKKSSDMEVEDGDEEDEVPQGDVLDGIDITDDEASLADGEDGSKEESKASSEDSESDSDEDEPMKAAPKKKASLRKAPMRAKNFALKKRARDGKARLPKKEKREVQRRKISA